MNTRQPLNPTLAEVGEREAINLIAAHAPSPRNGDDAAVLEHDAPNSQTVVSTDMLVQNRHFRLDWSTPAEIGKKAITQNFADVEAMGARPKAALLALSVPAHTRVQFVAELARGIGERVVEYGAELVGGDITDGDAVVISVTAVGQLGGSLPELCLDRARPGQHVVASGEIGASAAGLALLQRFGRDNIPEEFAPLVQSHCAAKVPPGRGFVARSAGVSSMTDNSDGLIVDTRNIARRSNVSINLFSDAIAPSELLYAAAELLQADPWEWVLQGGEDHTLIGTTTSAAPTGYRVIGRVDHRSEGEVLIDGKTPLFDGGWSSFATST
ncbi:thiamine-phosphate kinase [Corynebacterium gerontici]|uniref:Thiamine-monophosphate kinase n=1 Tax=Corynebacterium gerontici TaxID=2079234 RepID=A0A3G6IZV0_9CORY|nr:thiamine-phosphate kinase [Corynebacterium gerontici]AZA11309.1 Thiamine-monophosphate kinase [Corynebacterium gerontici]